MNILWVGCAEANFGRGRRGYEPKAIVVHIMKGALVGADNLHLDPRHGMSAHYGVGRDGRVHHYVADADTAYHCGVVSQAQWGGLEKGTWGGYVNPDWYTLGIDHEGFPGTPWPEAQYATSAELVAELAARHGFPVDLEHVIGHEALRASENCPGTGVDLGRLVEMAKSLGGALGGR